MFLHEERVRFLIVDAHAPAAHGVPPVTGDLDVWIEPSRDNAAGAWRALVAFGAPLPTLGIGATDLIVRDQVIQLGLPPFRIDVLTTISGVEFDEAWSGAIDGILFDVPVRFIGRDAFIRNKRASGRPKDLEDIRALEGR